MNAQFVKTSKLSIDFLKFTWHLHLADISHMTFARLHRRALRVPVYPQLMFSRAI